MSNKKIFTAIEFRTILVIIIKLFNVAIVKYTTEFISILYRNLLL